MLSTETALTFSPALMANMAHRQIHAWSLRSCLWNKGLIHSHRSDIFCYVELRVRKLRWIKLLLVKNRHDAAQRVLCKVWFIQIIWSIVKDHCCHIVLKPKPRMWILSFQEALCGCIMHSGCKILWLKYKYKVLRKWWWGWKINKVEHLQSRKKKSCLSCGLQKWMV